MECNSCNAEIPEFAAACPKCGREAPQADDKIKKIFSGRYDIRCLLGIGGFAEVYLARDKLLDREVAIKILLRQHSQDPQTIERFLREARLYAKLEHKNIIPIYDTGIIENHVFITMKYIRGESLKHLLFKQKRMAPHHLPSIIRGVAAALSYIHQQGIVHRDIKPANIIVEKASREVYLADFGIARAESSQTLTQTGMIVGTPFYLSPEQIKGGKIDLRSDIYALGATLYELVTGQPPFLGDSPLEILYQHINEKARSLPELVPGIDPVLERIITQCIEKNPARRFQNAEEILALLEQEENHPPGSHEKTILTPRFPSRPGKTKKVLFAMALFLALIFTAYLLWIKNAQPSPPALAHDSAMAQKQKLPEKEKPVADFLKKQFPPPGPQTDEHQTSQLEASASKQTERTSGHQNIQPPEKSETKEFSALNAKKTPTTGSGTIRFSSFPPLADVYFNAEKIGNTEQVFEKKFPPGDYLFSFSIPGYQSAEMKLSVTAGETVSAHHRFPPFRNFTITARPFGRVLIDDREYGDTPQTIKLAYGEHRVRVIKNGYKTAESNVIFDQNAKNSIYFELKKEDKK